MKKTNIFKLKFIDSVSGLKIYDVFEMFKTHQYLPKQALDKIRMEQLEALFLKAKQSTAFYVPFNSYKDLPALTKKMMKQNPGDFLSPQYQDKLFKKSTGGSTGTPFVYHTSVNAQSALWAGLLLSWEATGYQFGDKVSFIAGSALIKTTIKHSIFYKIMNIDLYPAALLTDEIILQYLQNMQQKKTKLIYGYAMVINIIADYIIENNIEPIPDLKSIVCTSEMLTDKMKANIEQAFKVKVFNQYGCNEAGISAFECEDHKLHLISSRSYYEIDKDGCFLSTDLLNDAYIFMKYNTGDLVEFSDETCNCGRNYPIIKKIIGRSDDFIIDRNNKKIHSAFFSFLFKKYKSVKQYQILFDNKTFHINLKVDDDFSQNNLEQLTDSIKENMDFEVYDIKQNQEFYKGRNTKHAFIINKRLN